MNKALAEQAGGDERAAFERAFTVQEGIYFDDKRGEYRSMNLCAIEASDAQDLNLQLQGWQARAALAQPSPKPGELVVTRNEVGAIVAITRQDAEGRVLNVLAEAQPSTALELDYTHMSRRMLEELAKVGKCLVATADLERLTQERDAAQDRVAELEKQEPVATVAKVPGEDWNSLDFHRDLQDMQPGTKLYAAPLAQAQQLHDLDKQCRDDVARALGLRPNKERGFAWSYLLASIKSCVKASGDSAQAQHSVPEGWKLVPVEPTEDVLEAIHNGGYVGDDQELRWFYQSILAAAPAPGGE
ncbi:hypothetical protein RX598_006351 [Pseudomonas aeruginosa]|nr:hypothetical protein [Pseudomonas aeruginosa]